MFSSKQGVAFNADIEANANVPIGKLVRKTLYRFEAYPPVDKSLVLMAIGPNLYQRFVKEIEAILVPRGGDFKVPVGLLVEMLRANEVEITKEMLAVLFSQPMWVDETPNLVVVAGLNDSLDKHFKASAYTAAWYVGIVSGTPTFAQGDTMGSHAGWFEVGPYAGARPTLTLGTIVTGSVDNSASKASYSINATMVVGGAFLVTLPTQGQTSGTLYGGAAFSGGNRSVTSGDTLNVTVTLQNTAA